MLTSLDKSEETEEIIPFDNSEYEHIYDDSRNFKNLTMNENDLFHTNVSHQRSYSLTTSSGVTGYSSSVASRHFSEDEFKTKKM